MLDKKQTPAASTTTTSTTAVAAVAATSAAAYTAAYATALASLLNNYSSLLQQQQPSASTSALSPNASTSSETASHLNSNTNNNNLTKTTDTFKDLASMLFTMSSSPPSSSTSAMNDDCDDNSNTLNWLNSLPTPATTLADTFDHTIQPDLPLIVGTSSGDDDNNTATATAATGMELFDSWINLSEGFSEEGNLVDTVSHLPFTSDSLNTTKTISSAEFFASLNEFNNNSNSNNSTSTPCAATADVIPPTFSPTLSTSPLSIHGEFEALMMKLEGTTPPPLLLPTATTAVDLKTKDEPLPMVPALSNPQPPSSRSRSAKGKKAAATTTTTTTTKTTKASSKSTSLARVSEEVDPSNDIMETDDTILDPSQATQTPITTTTKLSLSTFKPYTSLAILAADKGYTSDLHKLRTDKSLTSAQRRALRNKLSARSFRERRREYMEVLERECERRGNEAIEMQRRAEVAQQEARRLQQVLARVVEMPGTIAAASANTAASGSTAGLTESTPSSSSSSTASSSSSTTGFFTGGDNLHVRSVMLATPPTSPLFSASSMMVSSTVDAMEWLLENVRAHMRTEALVRKTQEEEEEHAAAQAQIAALIKVESQETLDATSFQEPAEPKEKQEEDSSQVRRSTRIRKQRGGSRA